MSDYRETPPVNPLPPIVIALFIAIAAPEILFALAAQGLIGGPEAIGWRLAAIQNYGFSGDVFDWMMHNGRWLPDQLLRMLLYPFVHQSFTSALFAGVIFLAMGKLVGEVIGQVAVAVIFFGAAVFGAAVYALLLNDPMWLLGAYPPAYGLIGGYSYIMWHKLAGTGGEQYRAFSLIAMLMGIQLLWGVFADIGNGWVAELAGFMFGFGASILLAPGGIARFIASLRRD